MKTKRIIGLLDYWIVGTTTVAAPIYQSINPSIHHLTF